MRLLQLFIISAFVFGATASYAGNVLVPKESSPVNMGLVPAPAPLEKAEKSKEKKPEIPELAESQPLLPEKMKSKDKTNKPPPPLPDAKKFLDEINGGGLKESGEIATPEDLANLLYKYPVNTDTTMVDNLKALGISPKPLKRNPALEEVLRNKR